MAFANRGAAFIAWVLASLVVGLPADAANITFRAELKGSNEVPPNERRGRGILAATYDTTSRRLSWTGSFSGLSSKVTAIHFHGPANPNKNAGVVAPIRSLSGGSTILSEDRAADLIGGYLYVDIHTRSHPRGEIRGQMTRGR